MVKEIKKPEIDCRGTKFSIRYASCTWGAVEVKAGKVKTEFPGWSCRLDKGGGRLDETREAPGLITDSCVVIGTRLGLGDALAGDATLPQQAQPAQPTKLAQPVQPAQAPSSPSSTARPFSAIITPTSTQASSMTSTPAGYPAGTSPKRAVKSPAVKSHVIPIESADFARPKSTTAKSASRRY